MPVKEVQLSGQCPAGFCEAARARLRRGQALLAAGASVNASEIRTELASLVSEASLLGYIEVLTLARQGEGAARRIAEDPGAAVACARAIRALGRAIDAVEALPRPPSPSQEPRPRPPSPHPPAAGPAETPSRGHVLIVDDSRINADLLAVVLSEEGFAVEIAGTAAGLERALATSRIDLALSDVNMPELDVAVVCRRVREASPRARVLLLSGLAEEVLARECQRVHADGYLTRGDGLGEVIERVLAETAGRSA